ncbi:MAG: MFS transporter [Actinobacteria bacterium]|nr:MFS transporter [Actinomycetota bacterium]
MSAESTGSARRTLWLLVAAATFCYLAMGCYAAILPGYVLHHLSLGSAAVGLAMGATGFVAVALRPLSGNWGDRYGRRPLAVLGTLVLAVGSAALLGPGALILVVFARLLTGAGDALFTTAAMAWVVDVSRPERRGRAMATLGMAFWLGLALGPQWGVLVHRQAGYDAVWWGATGFALLAAGLVWLVGPSPRPTAPVSGGSKVQFPRGAVLPAVAMVLICYGNGVFEAFGIVHMTGRGIAGGAGLGAAASVFTVVAVTTFLGRFAGGLLADRTGPRLPAIAGVITIAISYGVLAVATSFAVAALGGALLGLGLALIYPALALVVTRSVGPAERGAGLGVFLAALDVTFAIGPLVGGLVVGIASTETALLSAAVVALLALPVVVAAGNPPVGDEPEEELELAEERPPAPV